VSDKKANILVVEDEMFVSEYICQSLTKLGYRVCGIADCYDEAIELVSNERPDLILLDIELSGSKNGIDVANDVTEKWAIPVVFLTAYSDEQTLIKAKRAKPLGYITKPFTENDIKIAVMMALEHAGAETSVIALGEGYLYDPELQQLCLDKKPVLLTKKEVCYFTS
jgi:DNA-binding response OmpR family regulator